MTYRIQPPSPPQQFLYSPLVGWSQEWKSGSSMFGPGGTKAGWIRRQRLLVEVSSGACLHQFTTQPLYLDRVYFQPLCRCLARKPAISKHWAATATCGHQTPFRALSPHSSFLPLPPTSTPSAAPAVLLKTLCPMAWANMLGHLSCEHGEWQDPPLHKAHKTSRPPLGVTQNWWDNKPWSWLSVTF